MKERGVSVKLGNLSGVTCTPGYFSGISSCHFPGYQKGTEGRAFGKDYSVATLEGKKVTEVPI